MKKEKTENTGKVIPNKTTTIEVPSQNGGVDLMKYSDLISIIIRDVRAEGFNIGEMRKCFRICEIAESANGEIVLSDEDFAYLKAKIPGMRWRVINKEIIQFEDDINAIN